LVSVEPWGKLNEEWFKSIYVMPETDEQFLWQKRFVYDQLYGKRLQADAFAGWATGAATAFGLKKDDRVYGAGCLCNIDPLNMSCELKLLIDPRTKLWPKSMRQAIKVSIEYAQKQGFERVYGYWPRIESRTYGVWERAIRKCARRVGLEKHAIRTAKRLLGRVQFEIIRGS
jgi:hypothetical protein